MRLIIKRSNDKQSTQSENTETDTIGTESCQVKQQIHLLPCKIHPHKLTPVSQTCTAPVDRYFFPYSKDVTDDVSNKNDTVIGGKLWHSSLRGKPLTGVQLSMPDGYVGIFCRNIGKTNQDENADLVADLSNGHVIQQLMYWNWDRIPTREDPLLSALDWVHISEAVMSNTN